MKVKNLVTNYIAESEKVMSFYGKKWAASSKMIDKMKDNPRFSIFLIALAIRSILGFIFYGSIDVGVAARESLHITGGGTLDTLPYFPGLHFLWWSGGALNIITPLPLLFCYKIPGLICDSLISILIYEISNKRYAGLGFKCGMIYALSPMAILVNSFHGQYDSICLFFLILAYYLRDYFDYSKVKYIIFGLLFGLSFMIKPYTLMFLVFFFEPFPKLDKRAVMKYISNQAYSIVGIVFITGISLGLFRLVGYDLKLLITRVFDYSKQGITFYGLPYTPEFASFTFLQNRFWIMGVLIAFSLIYYLRKIDSFEVILISFAFTLGVAKILVHYPMWIVPFLIITRRFKISAVVNFLFTAFLLLWYMNPYASIIKSDFMATFTTLNGFTWLMPPTFFIDESMVPLLTYTGNYLIPFASLAVVVQILVVAYMRILRKKSVWCYWEGENKSERLSVLKNGYLRFTFNLWAVVLAAYFLANAFYEKNVLAGHLSAAIEAKFKSYDLHQIYPYVAVGNYEELSLYNSFNIVFILFLLAAGWSIYNYYIAVLNKNSRENC